MLWIEHNFDSGSLLVLEYKAENKKKLSKNTFIELQESLKRQIEIIWKSYASMKSYIHSTKVEKCEIGRSCTPSDVLLKLPWSTAFAIVMKVWILIGECFISTKRKIKSNQNIFSIRMGKMIVKLDIASFILQGSLVSKQKYWFFLFFDIYGQ